MCELDHKESWGLKNWCFWTLVLEKSPPWTARRSNQSILKETHPEYLLEELMLKLQYFGHLTLMMGKIEDRKKRGQQRVRWLDGITNLMDMSLSEQALEVGDGQGSLVCCSPWGCRTWHDWATELTDWTSPRNLEMQSGVPAFHHVSELLLLLSRSNRVQLCATP